MARTPKLEIVPTARIDTSVGDLLKALASVPPDAVIVFALAKDECLITHVSVRKELREGETLVILQSICDED